MLASDGKRVLGAVMLQFRHDGHVLSAPDGAHRRDRVVRRGYHGFLGGLSTLCPGTFAPVMVPGLCGLDCGFMPGVQHGQDIAAVL